MMGAYRSLCVFPRSNLDEGVSLGFAALERADGLGECTLDGLILKSFVI